jgi:hypothetical protein
MNLVERSLQIPAGGVALDADLLVPEPAGGVVLFAHGSGSSRHSPRNRYVSGELQRSGLATVLADLLTPAEEQFDARTGQLPFEIGMLALRVTTLTDWLACRSGSSAPAPAPRRCWSRPQRGPARWQRSSPAAAAPTSPASTCAR